MKLQEGTNSSIPDPLLLDKQYHTATVQCNRRMTSSDWYQDVRQMEFTFRDEIGYGPLLRPNASEIIRLVTTLGTLQ